MSAYNHRVRIFVLLSKRFARRAKTMSPSLALPKEILNRIYSCLNIIKAVDLIFGISVDETSSIPAETQIFKAALDKNDLIIIQWLIDNNYKWNIDPISYASQFSQIEVVKCLLSLTIDQEEQVSTLAMDYAAAKGYLDMVILLHSRKTEGCTTKAMDYAAGNGHLIVVKWLHLNRTEGCSSLAYLMASERGHLDVINYLKETNLVFNNKLSG